MTYRVQVSIPYFTLTPEDVCVNDWHFDWLGLLGDPTTTDYTNLKNDVKNLYIALYPSATNGIAAWLRPSVVTTKIYNLVDPTPRVPRFIGGPESWGLTVGTAANIPLEASVCLSFQADAVAGGNQARRRGRIFLPGITGQVSNGGASVFPVVSTGYRSICAAALIAMGTAAVGHGWQWVVYSRADSASHNVTNGWIDDAVDTQRRRGNKASTRTTWVA